MIHFLAVVLVVLIFWLLGFLVEDIRSIKGPEYDENAVPKLTDIEGRHVDSKLLDERTVRGAQIKQLKLKIEKRQEEQRFVKDSAQNLERTINQLLELQKLSIQKDATLPDAQHENFTSSLNYFLQNQRKYQELNQEISQFLSDKKRLQEEQDTLYREIETQKKPARDEHGRLVEEYNLEFEGRVEAHRLKLAFFQLLVLLPLLGIAVYLNVKKRKNIYFPLFLAFGVASLLKVVQVIHAYFPAKYFKYILIAALILVVAQLLIHFIRTIASPKVELLFKQYREAYERFLCPVCEYPIRIGPRRFLYWTRRTVNKSIPQKEQAGEEEVYTCPSCGTTLFEECTSCKGVRHSLLAHCQHCGAEKQIN
jgi:predicted RNA-binding Zn-ribbon protein involved in translation (DUF1610 family)